MSLIPDRLRSETEALTLPGTDTRGQAIGVSKDGDSAAIRLAPARHLLAGSLDLTGMINGLRLASAALGRQRMGMVGAGIGGTGRTGGGGGTPNFGVSVLQTAPETGFSARPRQAERGGH